MLNIERWTLDFNKVIIRLRYQREILIYFVRKMYKSGLEFSHGLDFVKQKLQFVIIDFDQTAEDDYSLHNRSK
jgi:hypothetical protein